MDVHPSKNGINRYWSIAKLVFQANAITNLTLNMQRKAAIPFPAPSCMIVYATN